MKSFIEFISEGINDPAIFKVVFLAGGPGSGKSFMVKNVGLRALGFTIINSDQAFENIMRKSGLDMKMPENEKEQRTIIRARAKAVAGKKEELALLGRLGLIIDGTGKDYDKILKMRSQLALKGYDSAMVFVNTDLETALRRNAKRERSVPEKDAIKMWKEVQSNLGKFQRAFSPNFFIIDNSESHDFSQESDFVYKQIMKWSKEKPKNGVAQKWIKQQLNEETSCDFISQQQLKDLEKFGDRLLQKFDIDVEFTKHFGERMSDTRNHPCIKISELQALFKKIARDKGSKIKQHKNHEAILKDLQSDLNLPFMAKPDSNGEIELVLKTIMRKKNFKSTNPEVKYE
jgi:dephospho-CoA kinase